MADTPIFYLFAQFFAKIGDTVIFLTRFFVYLIRLATYFSRVGISSIAKHTNTFLQKLTREIQDTLKSRATKKQTVVFKRKPEVHVAIPHVSFSLKPVFNLTAPVVSFITTALLIIPRFAVQAIRRLFTAPPRAVTPQVIFKLSGKTTPRKRTAQFIAFTIGVIVTLLFVFIPYNFYLFLQMLPNPKLLSQRVIPVTTQIFDRNGNLLYEIHGAEDRKPLPLSEIPDIVKHATIAIEDREFYLHPGFSIRGITRAAWENFSNHNTQGGSTITQQLIKNALLTPEVSLRRKVSEVILAFWAEKIYTKDQILEMYLNQVPYGGTSWGIESAAETYFGKKVKDLTLAEATFLTGLPAAPTSFSPYGTRPQLAIERQHEVLRRMIEDGYITKEQAEAAKNEKLHIIPPSANLKAPHFVMYIRELASKEFGERLVDQGGLRITTTLDLSLQEKVQDIVKQNIENLARLRVGNGAAVVTNPQTGEILAMVGSKDYFDEEHDGNVNVALALRQPGSSIKVVNYAAALENGFTAATLIEDSPVAFPNPPQPAYAPVNYDSRFHGWVTFRGALANSYNIPAVKILNKIGVSTMVDMGRKMGISSWNDDSRFGLALTLGGGEVTLLEMNTVYGVMANNGKRVDPNPILKVTDYTGRVYYERPNPKEKQVLSEEVAFIMSDILADNPARTQAFGPNSALVVPGKTVSVKTGTTNDKRDNWTVGYTPSYVVGVWVGNNNNSPMDPYLTSGITGAAPIWNQIMQVLLKDKPNETRSIPTNIVTMPCYNRQEYFVRGTEPRGGCAPIPSPQPSPSPEAQ